MAYVTGFNSYAGLGVASTWGTAVNATVQYQGEISWSPNVQEILSRQHGSGRAMLNAATFGSVKPTVTLTFDVGYRNVFPHFLALLMGTSGAPSEVTASQADYKHTITFTDSPAKYATFAFKSASASVLEFPTAAVRSLTLRTTSVPGYLECSVELLANDIKIGTNETTENTASELAALSLTDTELAAVAYEDDFWINSQASGSLSSSNLLSIVSYELTLSRPMDMFDEIKGSSGNGTPVPTGLFEGSLNITTAYMDDNAYIYNWDQETVYKSSFSVEGTQIGSGTNKAVVVYLPGMKAIQAPTYNVTSEGVNQATYNFKLLKANSNPTGMSSTYPYFTVTNGLSTTLLA